MEASQPNLVSARRRGIRNCALPRLHDAIALKGSALLIIRASAFFCVVLAQAQATKPADARLDLNGAWLSKYGDVCITQTQAAVAAKFIRPTSCENGGGTLTDYFNGTLDDAGRLAGSINVCETGSMAQDCHSPFLQTIDFTATATEGQISITYTQLKYKYNFDAARPCFNKMREPERDQAETFTLQPRPHTYAFYAKLPRATCAEAAGVPLMDQKDPCAFADPYRNQPSAYPPPPVPRAPKAPTPFFSRDWMLWFSQIVQQAAEALVGKDGKGSCGNAAGKQ